MTKSHSKLEDEPELGIMDIKNWSYFRAIERNKVLFEFVKCRKTFEISNDVIPIFCGIREETTQVPISPISNFMKHIRKIYQDISSLGKFVK